MVSTKHNVQSYFTICPLTKAREQKKIFFSIIKRGKKINSTLSQIAWLETSAKHHQHKTFILDERKRKKYLTKQKSEIDFFLFFNTKKIYFFL